MRLTWQCSGNPESFALTEEGGVVTESSGLPMPAGHQARHVEERLGDFKSAYGDQTALHHSLQFTRELGGIASCSARCSRLVASVFTPTLWETPPGIANILVSIV